MPAFHEAEWLVSWTKDNSCSAASRWLQGKIVGFHRFVINHRKEYNYPLRVIANMEETPQTFDMPPNRTINNTGEKAIKIRMTGNEKNRNTVMLICAGDRSKLKQMVIFKRKTIPKVANKHEVVIAAQEKG